MKWTSNEIALLGVAATLIVTIVAALSAYLASKRERRRTLYTEAVQAIVGWKEMLYRVRRRTKDDEPGLVGAFHELQDKMAYYQAWIAADSKYMSRSYARLVLKIKKVTTDLIWQAWDEPIRPAPGKARPEEMHPDIDQFVQAFGDDCRSHLSPLPWRKLALVLRNRS